MSFLDHFTGSSLNARWTGVTGGSGTITFPSSDGYVTVTRPGASDVAYFYLGAGLAKTDTGLITTALRRASGGFGLVMGIMSTATPGTPVAFDAFAMYDVRVDIADGSGEGYLQLSYNDSTPNRQTWNPNTNAFAGTPTVGNESRVGYDNYIQAGIELDGTNERFRLIAWTVKAPTTSYTFTQGGPRIMQLSDWVDWADVNSTGSNLQLVIATPYNDTANAGTIDVEWLRFDDGAKVHAWTNGQELVSTGFDVRKWQGYGDVFVPVDRTTIAIPKGSAATWDDAATHSPMVVKDGANYRYFYSGDDGAGYEIGAATGTDPDAAPTKDGSNPVVTAPSGYDQVAFPYVIKDESEADANKLWKMLAIGVSTTGSYFRILYWTSPAYNGTWTYQGVVLSEGSVSDPDELGVTNPVPYWDGSQWIVFFARKRPDPVTALTIEDISYATGASFDALTKSDVSYLTWQANGEEAITANLNGNTATISSNTGFVADGFVYIDNDNTGDNYGISRIRKVNAGTLELYHRLDGFTSAAPGWIVQADRAHGQYLRHVEKVGGEFRFWGTIYRIYVHFSSPARDAYAEQTALWTHSGGTVLASTPTLEHLVYPPMSQTYFGHERSSENLTFATLPLTRIPIPRPFPTFRPVAS